MMSPTLAAFTVLFLPLAAEAAPAAAPVPLVLLVDTATVPADLAGQLTAALRLQVENSPSFRWQEGPPISAEELFLAMACNDVDTPCLKKVCAAVQAEALMVVALRGGKVSVTLFQARRGKTQVDAVPLAGSDATVAGVVAVAAGWLGGVTSTPVRLVSLPAGAEVWRGDEKLGVTPLDLPAAAPDSPDLQVRAQGYVSQRVAVPPGAPRVVEVTLDREPGVTPEVEPRQDPGPVAAVPALPPTPTPSPVVSVPEAAPRAPTPVAVAPTASAQPAPQPPRASSPASSPASRGIPAPVKWLAVAAGGGAAALSLGGVLVGLATVVASGVVYGLVWTVQATQRVGNVLVYPLNAAGTGLTVLGVLTLPVGLALVAGVVVADLVVGGTGAAPAAAPR
jgi:hypothetical protein